jgi:hypothetical protein
MVRGLAFTAAPAQPLNLVGHGCAELLGPAHVGWLLVRQQTSSQEPSYTFKLKERP